MSFFPQKAVVSPAELATAALDAGAIRMSGGKSFGSRGSRTYAAPPATKTVSAAAPIDQSMTDRRDPAPTEDPALSGAAALSLLVGWRGLFMGSLIAVSLGRLFGAGMDMLGFVVQFALIGGAVYFVVNFIRSRAQPAPASSPGSSEAPRGSKAPNCSPFTFSGGPAPRASALTIDKDDLNAFERLLGEIYAAYGHEDTDELGARTTPEMLSYFSRELYDTAKQGLRNEVSDVKLLRGDLSEAWRENGSDYATLAMRYSSVCLTVDRATGAVVSGDPGQSSQSIELWTFRRDDRARDEGWQLSAIQQAV